MHRRRRVGSRDDNRRRHLGVQRGQTRVRHVVDEIGAVVSAGAAYFQFILTHRHHSHFHHVQTKGTPSWIHTTIKRNTNVHNVFCLSFHRSLVLFLGRR